MKLFAYRPSKATIELLDWYYNDSPAQCGIVSNYSAMTQHLRLGCLVQSSARPEAPQERAIENMDEHREVYQRLSLLTTHQRAVLEAAYTPRQHDPKVTAAITPLLAPLLHMSRLAHEGWIDSPDSVFAIRHELDEMWRDAHQAFEGQQ